MEQEPVRVVISLLGRFEVLLDGAEPLPIPISSRKGRALLAYVALRPRNSVSREELATLLWGDCADQQARQSLRQCLLALRRDLGPQASDCLTADTQTVCLRIRDDAVDAKRFAVLARSENDADIAQAAALYNGELLVGLNVDSEPFEEWLRSERSRLAVTADAVFAQHIESLDRALRGSEAIEAAERLLAFDVLREDRHRLLLRLYTKYAGAETALARARTFAALLKRELDVDPQPATIALIEAIRLGEIKPAAATGEAAPVASAMMSAIAPVAHIARAYADALEDQPDDPPGYIVPPQAAPNRSRSIRHAAMLTIAAGMTVGAFGLTYTSALHSPADTPQTSTVAPGPQSASWQSPRRAGQPDAEPSSIRRDGVIAIVVLPFQSHAEDGSSTIADVITDDLTNMLSRIAGFRVISRQTAQNFRGQRIDPATIGAELGVHYLLEGSASMRGDRLRVNVELVDAQTRLHVWSNRFDRAGDDRHAVQDEIVKSLGRALQIGVFRIESHRGSSDPDVHELVFKGWTALSARGTTGVDALQRAKSLFEQALARDPENARAQHGVAAYHVQMAVQLFAADPDAHLTQAEAILKKLIEQQPTLGGAHTTMGMVHVARTHWKEAIRSLERGIEFNPSHAPSYAQLGRALVVTGRPAEGREHVLYATRLSPRDPLMMFWLAFAGSAELELGNYDAAVSYLDHALALNPGQPRTTLVLVAAQALRGNISEARLQLDRLQKARPHLTREQIITRFKVDKAITRTRRFQEGLSIVLDVPSNPKTSQTGKKEVH